MYVVYTDGACVANGAIDARGGMGVYSEDLGWEISTPWSFEETPTNQRCEMMAVALAIAKSKHLEQHIHIRSDSEYVVKGMTEWLGGWKLRGWKNSKGKPVKNRWLWELLDSLIIGRDVTFEHVPAHVGIHGNEMADQLAYGAIQKEEESTLL